MGNFQPSRTAVTTLQVAPGATGGTMSIGAYHIYSCELDIRYADSTDNTIVAQLPNFKIPAGSIVTRIYANVKTLSNLSTMALNMKVSETGGQVVDAVFADGAEVLGADATNTDSSDSTSASDITMGTSANDLKESWFNNDTWNIGALGITNDIYVYVCNAGTGNGTTNPTAGTLSIIVEYYGND